jgi:hypothetical protein
MRSFAGAQDDIISSARHPGRFVFIRWIRAPNCSKLARHNGLEQKREHESNECNESVLVGKEAARRPVIQLS